MADSCINSLDSLFKARESQVQTQIGIAILAKGLQATQLQGNAANALLEEAARLSQALGKGENFSAVA